MFIFFQLTLQQLELPALPIDRTRCIEVLEKQIAV
jgi:hypothetical protein